MSSFINMMGNDVWSDDDIVSRTEAVITSVFPPKRFAILDRKFKAALAGHPEVMDDAAKAELLEYQTVCYQAGAMADAARADMTLLRETMSIEPSMVRLDQPVLAADTDPLTGAVLNQDDLDKDAAERAAAQTVITAASQPALDLARQRNPLPTPTKEDVAAAPGEAP